MKPHKTIDKKLVFLFLVMMVMIAFMFYFLNKQKKQDEELSNIQSGNTTVDILTSKQKKINKLLNEEGGLFGDDIEILFDDLNLKSYVDLPLEVGQVGNPYPFGNPEVALGSLE